MHFFSFLRASLSPARHYSRAAPRAQGKQSGVGAQGWGRIACAAVWLLEGRLEHQETIPGSHCEELRAGSWSVIPPTPPITHHVRGIQCREVSPARSQCRHSTAQRPIAEPGLAACKEGTGEVRALPDLAQRQLLGGRLLWDPFPLFPGIQSVLEIQRSGVRPSIGPWVRDFWCVAIRMCVLTQPHHRLPGRLSSGQRGEGPEEWEKAGPLLRWRSACEEKPSQETPVKAPALNKARGAKASR